MLNVLYHIPQKLDPQHIYIYIYISSAKSEREFHDENRHIEIFILVGSVGITRIKNTDKQQEQIYPATGLNESENTEKWRTVASYICPHYQPQQQSVPNRSL